MGKILAATAIWLEINLSHRGSEHCQVKLIDCGSHGMNRRLDISYGWVFGWRGKRAERNNLISKENLVALLAAPHAPAHYLLELRIVLSPHFLELESSMERSNRCIDICWRLVVGIGQHRNDTQRNRGHCMDRKPSLRRTFVSIRILPRWMKNGDAHSPIRIN